LKKVRIGLLHGKMKSEEKQTTLEKFKKKKLDIVVSTTVIEVGVDVPNATVIVIENSERFGLAQLHQLRGRVGRGDKQSYCLLFYSKDITEKAQNRLKFITNNQDGLKIAEFDLSQ